MGVSKCLRLCGYIHFRGKDEENAFRADALRSRRETTTTLSRGNKLCRSLKAIELESPCHLATASDGSVVRRSENVIAR